ncbi:uncharacterized protein N7515_003800 [Penicillium bovifimosum]|uniref:Uncharacterized protein n=1 Tax=Penicillium bovifimosum TaxID=126998 RepID=A0A9W9H5C8_9EURO|nr:uncharacterized protein N7515_003800 [Penicillium bovifimosum]KAJ5138952.1 hypothetical protein N7515_003800 [Penicillium bovifimosum]
METVMGPGHMGRVLCVGTDIDSAGHSEPELLVRIQRLLQFKEASTTQRENLQRYGPDIAEHELVILNDHSETRRPDEIRYRSELVWRSYKYTLPKDPKKMSRRHKIPRVFPYPLTICRVLRDDGRLATQHQFEENLK